MENKKLFEILSTSDRSERENLLRCISKHHKSIFCTNYVSDIIAKSIPIDSDVQSNFIHHCHMKLLNVIDYTAKIEGIRTVNSWMKYRNISFEAVMSSAEANWALNILLYNDSKIQDYQIAGEFFKMAILLMDMKLPSCEMFIQKVMELEVLFKESLSLEHAKVLCLIFTHLADKVFQSSPENVRLNQRILSIICICSNSRVLCESTFCFWKKLSGYLKNNREYEPYIEEFIVILTSHCRIIDVNEMETSANFMVFRENASEVLRELTPLTNVQQLLESLYNFMKSCTEIDLEVSLFLIASISAKIDRSEDKIMPKIIELIFQIDEKSKTEVLLMSVKLLGQMGHWISAFHHLYLVNILNHLMKFLEMKNSLSSAVILAIGGICTACNRKMKPHLHGLFEIFKNLNHFCFHSRSENVFIKGLINVVCNLDDPQRTELLKHLCEFQFWKIRESENSINQLIKSLDQLAEIFDNIKFRVSFAIDNPFGSIFIQHWPQISSMLDYYESNREIMMKITECIQCAIPNLGLSVIPVLDQVVKRLIYHYAIRNYNFLLRLMNVIVDKLGNVDECKDGFLITFEGVTMLTFNALHDEKKLNFPVIDEYFRLASTSVHKMPMQILKCPLVISLIEFAIELCKIDGKSTNRMILKFLYGIFGCNLTQKDVNVCVEQAMVKFGETLIKVLLESSIFVFDASLVTDVVDIFYVFKSKSDVGFEELFLKALQTLRKRNNFGTVTLTEGNLNALKDLVKMKNVPKTEMINGIVNFRKALRGY